MTMEKCPYDNQQSRENIEASTATMKGGEVQVDRNHFPSRLHSMLSSLENNPEGLAGVVTWQPHGRVFMIRDTDLFVEQLLPKWFCRLKYTSFQRQLCLYGFRKLSKKGPDQGGYYHLNFIRDRLDLAMTIQPGKIKSKRGRRPKSDETEPNFYQLSSMEEQHPVGEKVGTPAASPSSSKPAASTMSPPKMEPSRAVGRTRQLDENIFSLKDDSPEQLSLEAIMQQPQFQDDLYDSSRDPELHRLIDSHWPNLHMQQSLTIEPRIMMPNQQRGSITDGRFEQEESLYPPSVVPPAQTHAAATTRSTVERRLSDFSVNDGAPTWGWDSFNGLVEDNLAVSASLEQPTLSFAMGGTLPDRGYIQSEPAQLLAPQHDHSRLQQILQQQRLKDLMDLNLKQQTNLQIQQVQLEQQRLELQMRDQEQLQQLRAELQARGQQTRRQSFRRVVEPLPRAPELFRPQPPGPDSELFRPQTQGDRVAFLSQWQHTEQQSPQRQQQQQQQQPQQQQQQQGERSLPVSIYDDLFQLQETQRHNNPNRDY